ncbi:MAG: HAMP domain-containing histidine kinase [Lachnospiraceae bacterium]|nr:HAMP domain-containing histidine kinase [Lachnospiraceae bacterium]
MEQRKAFQEPKLNAKELSAELVIANLRLKEAHEQLKRSEEARSEMFANISHDLRSPITVIKNTIELLLDKKDLTKESATPLLSLMNQRIDLLEKLINDIFLLVTLDNHCIQMEYSSIPLGFFLEDYFFSCQADSKYKNRNLKLEVSENFSGNVLVDPKHLTRVLDNLFNNALKYSNSGDKITLGAYLEGDHFIVYVKDSGIGISPEDKEKIFERCFIAKKARTPGISSSGLGLYITKSILTYFNGDIWCESTPNMGSCFSFSIPLQSLTTKMD